MKAKTIFILTLVSIFLAGVYLLDVYKTRQSQTVSVSKNIEIITKKIKSIDDIESITSNLVNPVDYKNVLSLADLPIKEKKAKFIDLVLPAILISKYEYQQKLEKVKAISLKSAPDEKEQEYLVQIMEEYGSDDLKDLEKRLITHPVSIVLGQASIESGWGTSRFFIEGSNVFGVWSFDSNEPRIKTQGTRNGKHIYVKKYSTISESINDYFGILAKGGPYRDFRNIRAKTDNPYKIIKHLDQYCELGEKYVTKLKNQIKYNKFDKYDTYKINSEYLK